MRLTKSDDPIGILFNPHRRPLAENKSCITVSFCASLSTDSASHPFSLKQPAANTNALRRDGMSERKKKREQRGGGGGGSGCMCKSIASMQLELFSPFLNVHIYIPREVYYIHAHKNIQYRHTETNIYIYIYNIMHGGSQPLVLRVHTHVYRNNSPPNPSIS